MAEFAPHEDSADVRGVSRGTPRLLRPDLLLTQREILHLWDVTGYRLAKEARDHPEMRVQRRGYQPYYPIRSVIRVLGTPREERLRELLMKSDEEIIRDAIAYVLAHLNDDDLRPAAQGKNGAADITPRYQRWAEREELAA